MTTTFTLTLKNDSYYPTMVVTDDMLVMKFQYYRGEKDFDRANILLAALEENMLYKDCINPEDEGWHEVL